MSFTFDQEYMDFLKMHEEDFKKEGFLPADNILDAYLSWIEGNALCACDHGCNQALAANAAKLAYITRVLMTEGYAKLTMDAMCLKNPSEYTHELHDQVWERAKAKREIKD